jgi:methylmalonyl-CoA mutase N-terminal domain/subunit
MGPSLPKTRLRWLLGPDLRSLKGVTPHKQDQTGASNGLGDRDPPGLSSRRSRGLGPREAGGARRFPLHPGVHPEMYRSKLWTMRQYAGFGSAEATNERFKFLLDAGQTGLSCAFDLPTQMGYDSDHPRAEGEVGKVGVAIDSLADMRLLMADLPMDKVTTSMTINATGAILLLLYQLVAEEQGVPGRRSAAPSRTTF